MILAHAGKNATSISYHHLNELDTDRPLLSLHSFSQIFSRLHSNNVLSMLEPEQALGFVDLETLPKEDLDSTEDEDQWKKARANIPPLSSILNLNDMEVSPQEVLSIFCWADTASKEVAKTALSSTVFTFYSSTGEDGWGRESSNINYFSGLPNICFSTPQ